MLAMVINSLHAGNLRHMGIHCADQRFDQVVLLRTCRIFADYYDHHNDDQNTKCFEMLRPMFLLFNPNQFTIITSALVHINEPALVEFTDDGSVGFCHSLVQPTQQDALDLKRKHTCNCGMVGADLPPAPPYRLRVLAADDFLSNGLSPYPP